MCYLLWALAQVLPQLSNQLYLHYINQYSNVSIHVVYTPIEGNVDVNSYLP